MECKHIFIMKPDKSNHAMEAIIVKVMKGYRYEIKYTHYPRHAIKIAKGYQGCTNRIYVVGGDGMLHEVVQGLAGSDNELVIIPMGTGNDFIRSIATNKDPETLLRDSLTKSAQAIDLIKANDIYCINVFCCAFDSDIANNVHHYAQVPYLPKSLQYVKVLLHRLVKYRLYPTKLLVANKVIYEDCLVVGAFCNGRYFGGGFQIGPTAKLDDGMIDINLVARLKKREIPYYLYLLLSNKLSQGKLYYHQKLPTVTVVSKQEVNMDGETYPAGTYHLEVVSKQLKIVLYR